MKLNVPWAAIHSLSHRFSGGLYFQAAYTYSKSIDNGSDRYLGMSEWVDPIWQPTEPGGQRAVSDFDRRHRFVVSYNYDLPVARYFTVTGRASGEPDGP